MTADTWRAAAARSLARAVGSHEERRIRPLSAFLGPLPPRVAEALALPESELAEPVECERCGDAGVVLSLTRRPRACRCQRGIARLLAESGLAGAELERMSVSTFRAETADQRQMRAAALAFLAEPRGSIAFIGDKGRGKSHLAVGIVRAWCELGRPGRFEVVPRLLDRLQATLRDNASESYEWVQAQLAALPLLVLDDLGAQRSTPWRDEALFELVNARHNRAAPTVVTSNVALDQLDGRIADRLMQLTPHGIVVTRGTSVRVTGVER